MHGPCGRLVLCALVGVLLGSRDAPGQTAVVGGIRGGSPPAVASLEAAQRLFYMARFAEAAESALTHTTEGSTALAAYELRTSALHFQVRRAMGPGKDRKAALAACSACSDLLETFFSEITRGTQAARARLAQAPEDDEAMYYLAKLDLNYLWMRLSTLGQRTGWDQYWEAKRLIEAVLAKQPMHLRTLVARAWMDYIVGTRVPWGARWVMGGGNRDRALDTLRATPPEQADFYAKVEADFALLEMLTREGKRAEALPVAQGLLEKFPENEDLQKFVRNR